jgi:hypothetical protein
MAERTAAELRAQAKGFREMAASCSDPRLEEALLLVAEEFEREAAMPDASEARPQAPS